MLRFALDPREDRAEPDAIGDAEVHIASSIRAIGREEWDACFEGQVERYDCLIAIEESGLQGFEWRYVAVYESGRLMAAMPAFLCVYLLDTTLREGTLRRVVRSIRAGFPAFLTLPLACLGSPCTETCTIGFHPEVSPDRKALLFLQLLAAFEEMAKAEGCAMIGVKDVPLPLSATLGEPLSALGYASIEGLATASLDVDFTTIDDYLSRLSASTRKDLRRKLRSEAHVSVELRTQIDDLLPEIMTLYRATRARSEWQFEELTESYFTGMLEHLDGRAVCVCYRMEGRLLAVNLLVHDGRTLVDKFFCMDGQDGRRHNLYFLSWVANLRFCLDHGMRRYQSGQAYHENKVRLGSRLTPNLMYFRHRNPVLQALLRLVSPLFSLDESLDGKT
ncbi:GNAT family N-acetyltransferase [Rhizobium sp. RAF56]|uniref:GNAT family N-acetyltransferase n=1 Tax=Rhizobium sp. RAF56 TaxID=3233062 RepID=UPI003F9A2E6C